MYVEWMKDRVALRRRGARMLVEGPANFPDVASETEKWGKVVRFQGYSGISKAHECSIRHFGYCIICPIFSATACGNRKVSRTI